jgi:hypothetical protein
MKTIFTNTLPPDEKWFNAMQNIRFNDGCQNGEYPRIRWQSMNKSEFNKLFYSTAATTLERVQFAGGLRVPAPSTPLSPINNSYLQSTLSANQLNVTAPGTWINYQQGVLVCPKRARTTVEPGAESVDTVFGLKTKTWLVNYAPNNPPQNGVTFGANFFTIADIPTEPLTVTITRNPVAPGGVVNTEGYNFLEWQHDPITASVKVSIYQLNTPYLYQVTMIF